MRTKLVIFFTCLLLAGTARSQELSVDELLTLTAISSSKFDQFIAKKGFSRANSGFSHDSIATTWEPKSSKGKKKKEVEVLTQIERYQNGRITTVLYRTSSHKELVSLRSKLKREGFGCPADSLTTILLPSIYTKKNITVELYRMVENDDTLFCLKFEQKRPRELVKIQFAEDLVQFDSHDDIVEAFGAENVKKDLYYFADRVSRSCTVLYPHSNAQVVFLWNDDSTCTQLASVIFGGTLDVSSNLSYTSQVGENNWRLSSGIHCNLNLRELIRMNEGDFEFYGTKSKNFLSIVPQENTVLDLEGVTIVLGCLNCSNRGDFLNNEKVSAQEAIERGLGMFVNMVIISPDRREQPKPAR